MFIAALAVLALQEDAEATFKKIEKQYFDAKAVAAKFKLVIQEAGKADPEGTLSGRITLKPGDKFAIKMIMSGGGKEQEVEAKADGKTTVSINAGRTKEENTKEGTSKFFCGALTRTGIGVMFFLGRGKEEKAPDYQEYMKVSAFKLSDDGKDKLLEYTVTLKELGDVPVKLWLTADLVPKKRELIIKRGEKEATFTETYEEISTAEIADSEFEHKK